MKQYVIDAFTDSIFQGNPAAVCVVDQWPPETLMQRIAGENNLSETAFVLPEGEHYRLALVHTRRRDRPLRPRHPGHGLYAAPLLLPGQGGGHL